MRSNPFANTQLVPVADIVRRTGWQVRSRMAPGTVARYATIYKAGGDMDPVSLALIGTTLVLIDGAHRMDAQREIGRDAIEATVTKMTEAEAQWAAASANLEHGQPLKKGELREVFRHYIATKQHRIGRSKVKPLRDIAKDLPGVSHVTVRNWLMKDHPELYRNSYAGSGSEGHSHGGLMETVRPSQRERDLAALEENIRQAAALVSLLPRRSDRTRAAKLWALHVGPLL